MNAEQTSLTTESPFVDLTGWVWGEPADSGQKLQMRHAHSILEGALDEDLRDFSDADKRTMAAVVSDCVAISLREEKRQDRLILVVGVLAIALVLAAVAAWAWLEWSEAATSSAAFEVLFVAALIFGAAVAFFTLFRSNQTVALVWIKSGVFIVIGLAAATFLVAARYPGLVGALFVALGLGFIAFVAALSATALIGGLGRTLMHSVPRWRTEPYAELVTGLLYAYHGSMEAALPRLDRADDVGLHYVDRGPIWSLDERVTTARWLDKAAVRLSRNADVTPRLVGRFAPETRDALRQLGPRVAAWLRQVELEILWPSPQSHLDVRPKLASGLAAACLGNWPRLEAEPSERQRRSRLGAALPRVALVVVLIGAAFLVPTALDLSADQADTVRLTLVLAAIGALAAGTNTVSDVLKQLGDQLTKPP